MVVEDDKIFNRAKAFSLHMLRGREKSRLWRPVCDTNGCRASIVSKLLAALVVVQFLLFVSPRGNNFFESGKHTDRTTLSETKRAIPHSSSSSILFVGLALNLEDVINNDDMLDLFKLYGCMYRQVTLNVVYRNDHKLRSQYDVSIRQELEKRLGSVQQSRLGYSPLNCHNRPEAKMELRLTSERELLGNESQFNDFHSMNRFGRIALLRSLQRASILKNSRLEEDRESQPQPSDVNASSHDPDAVIVVDLDSIHIEDVNIAIQATERVIQASNGQSSAGQASDKPLQQTPAEGMILCSNGYEVYKLGPRSLSNYLGIDLSVSVSPRLYYDTFASIDSEGDCWHDSFGQNIRQILTFGSARLFEKIHDYRTPITSSNRHPSVADFRDNVISTGGEEFFYPMRSCFGGVAFYDFRTWASPECDYISNGNETSPVKNKGDVCEHVTFHQCVTQNGSASSDRVVQIGITTNLTVERRENSFCPAVRTIFSLLGCFGTFGLIYLIFRRVREVLSVTVFATTQGATSKTA